MELCREIGVSFEAIPQPPPTNEGCFKVCRAVSSWPISAELIYLLASENLQIYYSSYLRS
jgi:hypothetical protein